MSEPFLGTVMIWAPNFAPRGWAYCQGQLMAISTNSALFSLLGVTYGGNGQTTFGLPNLQGRVPVGQGQSPGTTNYALGQVSGTENVTLTSAQMPSHVHPATFTSTGLPSVSMSLNATTAVASNDAPQAGQQLGDVSPNSTKIYAPAGGTQVALGGVSGELSGQVQGTVAIGPSGNSLPFSVVQPFQVLNYVIALEGVFPSRN
ncbi:tail fiber protein [Aquamicrobium sp. LC103]|uniref:phage tail protein n=1 Tax=Aquamicrobium sp. LC103 TaxID=1120658 RepID=UPI00063EB634|nr:tail fiber protein [Aquamicrobium sp. LC103]TKT69906.1 phage tail protein [Aquamicrobium sp. LC103]